MKNKNKKHNLANRFDIKLLLVLAVFIFVFSFFTKSYASPVNETKLVELANIERTKNNLKPLNFNSSLYFAASIKAEDMLEKDYFEHYTPDGKSPWDFIKSANYTYSKAGENLAMDFLTSEGITNAWMASPAHRANILDPDFDEIAIAAIDGDFNGHETTMVVEMFGKKENNVIKYQFNNIVNKITSFLFGL